MNRLDLAYLPLAIATAPVWARKTRGDWAGRMGKTARLPDPGPGEGGRGRKRLLIHAVSVGEVNTLRALIPLLTPHADVVVSVGTDTGIARARALFADPSRMGMPDYLGPERVVRYPLDLSWAVERFLNAVRPDAVALVELELWPNFVRACEKRGVPVCVINGRLSARSFKGYARARRFFRPVFERLAFAAVQDEAYAERFTRMGVARPPLVTGSMKWDSVQIHNEVEGQVGRGVAGAEALRAAMGIDAARPLIVAGSTGPLETALKGEEAMLDRACPAGVQLLCAPRKPERFDEAFAMLGGEAVEGKGNDCIRRSRCTADKPGARGADRFLLDTIGELRAAYALATVAVVGRSFGRLHGSDPIEPIALGVPTVIGPRYGDFESIVQAFRKHEAIVVAEEGELGGPGGVLARLIGDPQERRRLSENGRACIRAHQGATQRHAELLLGLLGVPVPGARA